MSCIECFKPMAHNSLNIRQINRCPFKYKNGNSRLDNKVQSFLDPKNKRSERVYISIFLDYFLLGQMKCPSNLLCIRQINIFLFKMLRNPDGTKSEQNEKYF